MSARKASAADRRRAYRVDDHVALYFRPLDPTEHEQALAELDSDRPDQPDRQRLGTELALASYHVERGLERIAEGSPEVAACIRLLNQKVDALARTIVLEDPDLGEMPRREVELSTSGLCFPSREWLAEGTPVELRLLLMPAAAPVRAVARVVRCTPTGGDTTVPYRLAVEIEAIRDDDREILARHIRQRETEILRARRDFQFR